MKNFETRARIALHNADEVIAAVCRHMIEHSAEFEELGTASVLRFKNSTARFFRDGEATVVDVAATDLESIYFARLAIASHIVEFSEGGAPAIEWTGDGREIARPPNFQIMEVQRVEDITPHMRRLTLAGADVARFLPLDALHLNILIQHPECAEPQWPTVGSDGLIKWPDPERRPHFRKYTVRSVDLSAGTLDIDFVMHADAGPGSALAERAKAGDLIGVAGPGGGGLVDADWYLFAGDETALPAIARMLETLPETAKGCAFIEVADAAEVQALRHPPGIAVDWLFRNGAQAGTTRLLPDAVESSDIPKHDRKVYVWVGCEFQAFRIIREHLRKERGLKKHENLVVSYWRRGIAET